MTIRENYDDYVNHCIFDPNFAEASVLWKKTGLRDDNYVIALNDTPKQFKEEDERVFFYADGIDGLCRLASAENGEDFVILPETVNFFEKL